MNKLTKESKLKFILDYIEKEELTAYQVGNKSKLSHNGIQNIIDGKVKNPQKATVDKLYDCLKNWDEIDTLHSISEPEISGYDIKISERKERIKEHESIIDLSSENPEKINHHKEMIKLLKEQIDLITTAKKNHSLDK